MYSRLFKRALDFVGSLLLLIILSPLLFFASFWLFFTLNGSVIFVQKRAGYHGHEFKLYKFKTMNDKRDASGKLLPDEKRLTSFGVFLRKWSIDELPGLINVLRGDISLIGPRPLLLQYLPLYTKEQSRRHEALPGVTGWAQVNGRNAISWEEKFNLDIWYVDHISFMLDLKILLLTLYKVIRRADINETGEATMSVFTGTRISKE